VETLGSAIISLWGLVHSGSLCTPDPSLSSGKKLGTEPTVVDEAAMLGFEY